MNAEDREPLDLLLEEFTATVRRGEAPDIESWAAQHPEHADSIRELFPAVLAIEGLRDESDRSGRATPIGIGVIERLGDYRIVDEIGRGGMGVVYEAEQESLGRRVAVKVLPPMRDPKRVRRFEREARTAAGLHHTNIVPIFGVGEHEGWHYYVMQVIRGVGLDAVLRALRSEQQGDRGSGTFMKPEDAVRMLRTGRFQPAARPSSTEITSSEVAAATSPTAPPEIPAAPPPADPGAPRQPHAPYWRSVADIGRQVADALAFAHSQGVLHRDVKPANLLLDAHGIVWVTDFGLAKAIGHDGITLSGDLVGTLQYMAPEQLHGRYDARTDVYGLGLTLYELLTQRPAFADGDRGSLIRKIEHGHPTPPSQVWPGIPRDLETIVLKAIQHDPNHRYQTASELAEDLQRFFEDRPILARRANAAEQLWRWCRRNRAVASFAAIAIVAVILAAVTGWTAYVSTSSALNDVRRASNRAEGNLSLALAAFEDVFDRVSGADRIEIYVDDSGDEASYEWYSPTSVSNEDAALLERILEFYDGFAAQNADSAALRLDTAKAHRRVGDLLVQLRRAEDARKAYERALVLFEEIDAGSGTHGVTLAALHNDLGRAQMESPEPRLAVTEFEVALEMLTDTDSRGARFERARAHEHLGQLSFQRRFGAERRGRGGRPPERGPDRERGEGREVLVAAFAHFRAAYDLYRALADEQPDNPAFQLAAARIGRFVALEFRPMRLGPGAADRSPIVADTLARLRTLVEQHPDVPAYRAELCRTWLILGERPRGTEIWRGRRDPRRDLRPGEATSTTWIADALALAEELYRERPDVAEHRRLLADALDQSARISADDDRRAAEAMLRRSLDIRPVEDSPLESIRAIDSRIELGRSLARSGDLAAGLEQVQLAQELAEELRGQNADAPNLRRKLIETLTAGARIREDAGDPETAIEDLRRAMALSAAGGDAFDSRRVLGLRLELALMMLRQGDHQSALSEVDTALSMLEGLPDSRRSFLLSRMAQRPFESLLRELRRRGLDEEASQLEKRLRSFGGR